MSGVPASNEAPNGTLNDACQTGNEELVMQLLQEWGEIGEGEFVSVCGSWRACAATREWRSCCSKSRRRST